MRAAQLRVPLVLETAVRTPDGSGGDRIAWKALGIVYAQMKCGAGRLRDHGTGGQSLSAWMITVRAFAGGDPRRPVPGQRFRMGMRIFRIDAVAETGMSGRFLSITAQEK